MSEDVTQSVTPMRELVAEEVRALLARRRVSASELARRLGVAQPYISRRLTGETVFDVDDLEQIAAALDVDFLDLFPSGQRPAPSATAPRVVKAAGQPARRGIKKRYTPVAGQASTIPPTGQPATTSPATSTARTANRLPLPTGQGGPASANRRPGQRRAIRLTDER